jgi:F-type H+-transporting ATPase subunit b
MPQLDSSHFITQVFWLFIVFSVIYFFVSKFFAPRINGIIEVRHQKINQDLNKAESLVKDYTFKQKKMENILEEAKSKATNIKTNAIKKIESDLNLKLQQIDKEFSKKLATEEERLYRVKTQVAQDIPSIAGKLAKEMYDAILTSKKLKEKSTN